LRAYFGLPHKKSALNCFDFVKPKLNLPIRESDFIVTELVKNWLLIKRPFFEKHMDPSPACKFLSAAHQPRTVIDSQDEFQAVKSCAAHLAGARKRGK